MGLKTAGVKKHIKKKKTKQVITQIISGEKL